MTISLIGLLNRVAFNEEVPEYIMYKNIIYRWTGLNYYSKEKDEFLDSSICLKDLMCPVNILNIKKEPIN